MRKPKELKEKSTSSCQVLQYRPKKYPKFCPNMSQKNADSKFKSMLPQNDKTKELINKKNFSVGIYT